MFRKIINRCKSTIDYTNAVKMADEYHANDGCRYYVVAGSTNGRLLVMDRSRFRLLKKKNRLDYSITLQALEEKAFYYTAHGNGTGMLSPEDIKAKRRDYYKWRESCYERTAFLRAQKRRNYFRQLFRRKKKGAS